MYKYYKLRKYKHNYYSLEYLLNVPCLNASQRLFLSNMSGNTDYKTHKYNQ